MRMSSTRMLISTDPLCLVFAHLTPRELLNCQRVDRTWRVTSKLNRVWRDHVNAANLTSDVELIVHTNPAFDASYIMYMEYLSPIKQLRQRQLIADRRPLMSWSRLASMRCIPSSTTCLRFLRLLIGRTFWFELPQGSSMFQAEPYPWIDAIQPRCFVGVNRKLKDLEKHRDWSNFTKTIFEWQIHCIRKAECYRALGLWLLLQLLHMFVTQDLLVRLMVTFIFCTQWAAPWFAHEACRLCHEILQLIPGNNGVILNVWALKYPNLSLHIDWMGAISGEMSTVRREFQSLESRLSLKMCFFAVLHELCRSVEWHLIYGPACVIQSLASACYALTVKNWSDLERSLGNGIQRFLIHWMRPFDSPHTSDASEEFEMLRLFRLLLTQSLVPYVLHFVAWCYGATSVIMCITTLLTFLYWMLLALVRLAPNKCCLPWQAISSFGRPTLMCKEQ